MHALEEMVIIYTKPKSLDQLPIKGSSKNALSFLLSSEDGGELWVFSLKPLTV
jgi:hypothetical protein